MIIKKSEFKKIVKRAHREFTTIVTAVIPWFILFTILLLANGLFQLPVAPLQIAGGFVTIIGAIGLFMYITGLIIGLTCSIERLPNEQGN